MCLGPGPAPCPGPGRHASPRGCGLASQGVLLVVSGPSGVGKGTVIAALRRLRPALVESVSSTTRPPRPGEVNGVDYHFVSRGEFEDMLARGELLESEPVYGDHLYGTLRAPVAEALAAGRDIVLEIDYRGAEQVRERMPEDAVLVFVAPPTWEELERRLQGRRTEGPAEVRKRLGRARREIENMGHYDYIVVNADAGVASREVAVILAAERLRRGRVDAETLQRKLLAAAVEE